MRDTRFSLITFDAASRPLRRHAATPPLIIAASAAMSSLLAYALIRRRHFTPPPAIILLSLSRCHATPRLTAQPAATPHARGGKPRLVLLSRLRRYAVVYAIRHDDFFRAR